MPPSGRTNWAEVDQALRANPGEWALVGAKKNVGSAARLASLLRHGDDLSRYRYTPLEIGAFEIERRGCEVYARYIGPGQATDQESDDEPKKTTDRPKDPSGPVRRQDREEKRTGPKRQNAKAVA